MAAAVVPLALAAFDYLQKQNQTDNVSQANSGLMRAMQGAQGQVQNYRNDLRGQMLQAMNNRLGAYNDAKGLLGSAMGGGLTLNTGRPAPIPGRAIPGQPPIGSPTASGLSGALLTGGPTINTAQHPPPLPGSMPRSPLTMGAPVASPMTGPFGGPAPMGGR